MRILFFIETGGPGGAEQVVLQLARGFQELGNEVGVATLRCGWLTDQLAAHGITHHHLPSEGNLDISLPLRLSRLLKSYDVLHTHLFDSGVYGALAAKLASRPHLSTEHGDIHHIDRRKFSSLKLQVLRMCKTQCTAVSEFSRRAMLEKGIPGERVTVVGNPLRPEQFERVECSLAELGVADADGAFVWTHVANHRPVKDQRTLLTGFAESLRMAKRRQLLLLIGDGPERAGLESLCSELGITDSVRFLGFRNDVQQLLSCADGAVLSSVSEALPMSLLEAGALGLALVSSDVGGVRDIITPEETGLLFPQADPTALAHQLTRLSTDPSLCAKLQQSCRTHIQTHFSLAVVLTTYESLYTGASLH